MVLPKLQIFTVLSAVIGSNVLPTEGKVCKTFEFRTVDDDDGNDCDVTASTSNVITLNGKNLGDDCYGTRNSRCTVEVCDDELVNGIATVANPNNDVWLFELRVNGERISPILQCPDIVKGSAFENDADVVDHLTEFCDCNGKPEFAGFVGNCLADEERGCIETGKQAQFNVGKLFEEDNNDAPIYVGAAIGLLVLAGFIVFFVRRSRKKFDQQQIMQVDIEKNPTGNNNIMVAEPVPEMLPPPTPGSPMKSPRSAVPPFTPGSPGQAAATVLASPGTVRSVLQDKYKEYLRQTTNTAATGLGSMLRTRFSTANVSSVGTRSAAAPRSTFTISTQLSQITTADVDKYKQKVSKKETHRHTRMFGNEEIMSMRSNATTKNLFFASTKLKRQSTTMFSNQRQTIAKICSQIDLFTLPVQDIRKLESEAGFKSDFYSGEEEPGISFENYVIRLVECLDNWFYDQPSVQACGVRSLLLSLVYLEKIKEKEEGFVLTALNRHRLFAVMMLIAAKFTEDCLIGNKYWAKACGVDVLELNETEEEFCRVTGFEFWVSPDKLQETCAKYGLDRLQ